MSRGLAAACGAVVAAFAVAGGAWAQAVVPVTVYDSGFNAYQAWGTADATGSVIVFDPGAASASPAAAPAEPAGPADQARGPAAPGPDPEPAAPEPAARAPRAAAKRGARAARAEAKGGAGKDYVDGVYAVDPGYLLSYPLNAYRILTGPVRYDRDDWINVALVAGVGGALLLLDETLKESWQDHVHGGVTQTLSDAFRPLGDSQNVVAGSLAAYLLAETLDSTGALDLKREKSAALLTVESLLLTQGLITSLKFLTGRERPEELDDALDFDWLSKGDFNSSFPSGHAGTAFALASVIAETYGPDNPWVPWLAYAAATGTALSRVDDDNHWFSDVFVGGAIGYFVGRTVTRYSPFLKENEIALMPLDRNGFRGIAVSLGF